LAPANLIHNIQKKLSHKPEIPAAINVETCRDLRLPNGKIIYPDSYDALEKTIVAWELNETEAKELKTKFWKLATPEYYNYCLNAIFALNSPKFNNSIFDKYNTRDLDELKLYGSSPTEMVKQCLNGNKLRASLPYYYKTACELAKAKGNLPPENLSPLDIFYGYQTKQPIIELVDKAMQTRKKYSCPVEVMNLLQGKSKARDYEVVNQYCSDNELTYSQTFEFFIPWWKQITFDDYHQEVRDIALRWNRLMNLDSKPIQYVMDSYENCVSPSDCISGVGSGGGGGGNGFNPPPQQPNIQHSYSSPNTSWGSGSFSP